MLDRETMLDYIHDAVDNADDITVEQFYWFLMLETTG